MNNGWYVVYILMCVLNGIILGSMRDPFTSWQFYAGLFIPVLCYIAGTNRC